MTKRMLRGLALDAIASTAALAAVLGTTASIELLLERLGEGVVGELPVGLITKSFSTLIVLLVLVQFAVRLVVMLFRAPTPEALDLKDQIVAAYRQALAESELNPKMKAASHD